MILLDTHVWIWWVTESKKLSTKALQTIEQANYLGVHIISCWEVAMLVEKGRIAFNQDIVEWINLALQRPKVTLLNFEPKTAILAARLKNFHGDPADRFLVAYCLTYDIPLITKDQKIHNYKPVKAIW